jgi:outer membrane protein assembly factor BamA
MRQATKLLALASVLAMAGPSAWAEQTAAATVTTMNIISAIRVQGNTLTPDDEVVMLSGLSVASPFSDDTLSQAADRLTATRRFRHVEVLKRYASISDPTQIVALIRVDEGPVRVVPGASPGQPRRVVRRGALNVMFVPLLDAEDGYGLAYGAQLAITGNASTTSRVVIPLSWGGDKRAAIEFQKELPLRLAPRVRTGALVQRRTHPFFHSAADRARVWGRVELSGPGAGPASRWLRAGATAAWQRSTLLGRTDTTRSLGADLVLDTRLDPMLPRNAVYARAAVDRLRFPNLPLTRTELEADGYLGLYRGAVLVLGTHREDASGPLPPFFKSVLGGASSLRGFRAGTAIGDTMVNGSAEVRMPLTSPLTLAKFGTSIFIDTGTAYDKGQRLRDGTLSKGVGGGVWATAALFRLSFMVAHGMGAGTRVHFDAGLTF